MVYFDVLTEQGIDPIIAVEIYFWFNRISICAYVGLTLFWKKPKKTKTGATREKRLRTIA